MKLENVLILVFLSLAIVGCNKNQESKWGTFNEPVESQPLPEATGTAELLTVWKQKVGNAGENGYAILRPAVSGEGVFVVNRRGTVRLLDKETGKTKWTTALGKSTYAGVGVGAGVALVAFDNGVVVALDSATGEERWRNAVNRQISAVPVAGTGRAVVRTADGLLIGLDATNGEKVWELERQVPGLSLHGDSQPLISGDAVITGLSNGRILVNSVVTGREFWEKDVSIGTGANELEQISDVDATPVIAGQYLYAGIYQGEVVALNLQDSSILWQFNASSRLPLSVAGNQLLLTDALGSVISLDAEGGFLNWEQKGFQGRGISNPLLLGQRVLIGDASGNVHLLDSVQGALLQTLKIGGSAILSMQQIDDKALAFTADGTVVLLAL